MERFYCLSSAMALDRHKSECMSDFKLSMHIVWEIDAVESISTSSDIFTTGSR